MLSRTETSSAPGVKEAAGGPGGRPGLAAVAATDAGQVRIVSARVGVWRRTALIWEYRNLLRRLIAKELKVKYKNSALGFLWSMLNPAFNLLIYYFVFQLVLGSGIHFFAIYLMSGLLAYNLFRDATMAATTAMVGNAELVKKVAFPREILPLASVGAAVVFFFLQAIVLAIALAGFRRMPAWHYLPLLVPAFVALVLLSAAIAVFLAAVNVYLRDTQHLIEILIGAAWFWATPIVYSWGQIMPKFVKLLPAWVFLLNPLTDIVVSFQRAIYGLVYGGSVSGGRASIKPGVSHLLTKSTLPPYGGWWYAWHDLIVIGVAAVLLMIAMAVFGRLEGNFAEEL